MKRSCRIVAIVWTSASFLPGLSAAQSSRAYPSGASSDTIVVTLEAMVRVAVDKNIALRIQRLNRNVADADVLSAGAAFDPDWSLALSRISSGTSMVGFPATDARANDLFASFGGLLPLSTRYALGVAATDSMASSAGPATRGYSTGAFFSLAQPMLRGFGTNPTTAFQRSARHSAMAAEQEVKRQTESVIAQVEDAFWLLQLAEVTEQIASESLRRARDLQDRSRMLRERDLISELSLITSERSRVLRESGFLSAQRQRVDAAERLVFLVYGEQSHEELVIGGATVRTAPSEARSPSVTELDASEKYALRLRSDVAAARERLAGAEARLVYARDQLKPQMDLTFSMRSGGVSDRRRPFSYTTAGSARSTTFSVGASIDLPQFNRRSRAEEATAVAQVEQLRLATASVENEIRREIRAAARGVVLMEQSLVHSERGAALAQREYGMARTSFELGQISVFQFFQYEETMVSSHLARAVDLANHARAVTAYHLASGNIGDRYGVSLAPRGERAR